MLLNTKPLTGILPAPAGTDAALPIAAFSNAGFPLAAFSSAGLPIAVFSNAGLGLPLAAFSEAARLSAGLSWMALTVAGTPVLKLKAGLGGRPLKSDAATAFWVFSWLRRKLAGRLLLAKAPGRPR